MSRHQQRQTSFQKKTARKERRAGRRRGNDEQISNDAGYGAFPKPTRIKRDGPLVPKNDRQKRAISLIKAEDVILLLGPAGTGKTYLALAVGVALVKAGIMDRLLLTKPFFEIDEQLGTLPGDENEKTGPLKRSMTEILIKLLGQGEFEAWVASEKIVFRSLGTILGLNFDRTFAVIDEAQNTTPGQMKVFLTRHGEGSKAVICGDFREQCFQIGRNGLEDAYFRFRNTEGVGVVEFTIDDIVRKGFCKRAIIGYRNSNVDMTDDVGLQ